MQWPALGGEGPTAVPCKTCCVLLCVLEQPRVYNSNWLKAGPTNIHLSLSVYLYYLHEYNHGSINLSCLSTQMCTCLHHCICYFHTYIHLSVLAYLHMNMHLSLSLYIYYPHEYTLSQSTYL